MKIRMSALGGAVRLPDGSMSLGFASAKETHTLELSAQAQEQLIVALLATHPTRPQKSFQVLDVAGKSTPQGALLSLMIGTGIAIHLLLNETTRQKLLTLLDDLGPAASAAH